MMCAVVDNLVLRWVKMRHVLIALVINDTSIKTIQPAMPLSIIGRPWASYQIRKIAGCACAGNAGNVFPRRRFLREPLVSDPGMHHGTCVTHVPWCMPGSLTCGDGENVPGIPGACASAILRIWQEAHYIYPNIVIGVKRYDPEISMIMGWWKVKGHKWPKHGFSWLTEKRLGNLYFLSQILCHWYLIYALFVHMYIAFKNIVLSCWQKSTLSNI